MVHAKAIQDMVQLMLMCSIGINTASGLTGESVLATTDDSAVNKKSVEKEV